MSESVRVCVCFLFLAGNTRGTESNKFIGVTLRWEKFQKKLFIFS